MSLPESHPPVHQHNGKKCPMAQNPHDFCPPQTNDVRSVCPALNTMANHGYIARDGRNLNVINLTRGLMSCYGLSFPLALFLSIGGFVLLKRIRPMSLHDLNKHNAVEHNASLVHHDIPQGETYAPIDIDLPLVETLIDDSKVDGKGSDSYSLVNAVDVARSRIRREKQCGPVDAIHAEIARGEMAIILGVWEQTSPNKVGIPAEWLRLWISHERMPDGWKPSHVQGLFNVVHRSKEIRIAMNNMRQVENEDSEKSHVVPLGSAASVS